MTDQAELEARTREAMRAGDWQLADQLGQQLDAIKHPVKPLLGVALWYAKQGIPVFPLRPGTKRPLTAHGVLDASIHRGAVMQWWTKTPNANIGLATGHRFDVVDIDGPEGVRSRLDNWDTITGMGNYGTVSTPRPGGIHIYVPAVNGMRNQTKFLPGIDYRGIGGYVVAPPSVISENEAVQHGCCAGAYHWLTNLSFDSPPQCRIHGADTDADCDACNPMLATLRSAGEGELLSATQAASVIAAEITA